MTLSLQEISDRLEIQDALLAYSTALKAGSDDFFYDLGAHTNAADPNEQPGGGARGHDHPRRGHPHADRGRGTAGAIASLRGQAP